MAIDLKSIQEEKTKKDNAILNEFTDYVESTEFDRWVEQLGRDAVNSHSESFKFFITVSFDRDLVGTILFKGETDIYPAFVKCFGVEYAEQFLSDYFFNFKEVVNKKLSAEHIKYKVIRNVLDPIVVREDVYVPWSEKLHGCYGCVEWEVPMIQE